MLTGGPMKFRTFIYYRSQEKNYEYAKSKTLSFVQAYEREKGILNSNIQTHWHDGNNNNNNKP